MNKPVCTSKAQEEIVYLYFHKKLKRNNLNGMYNKIHGMITSQL